ncbi:putative Dna replication licensing factor Mcm7, partial [Cardiosporidium cionae]
MAYAANRRPGGAAMSDRQRTLMDKINRFDEHEKQIQVFLEMFESSKTIEEQTPWGTLKYRNALQQIYERKSCFLHIAMDDIYEFFSGGIDGRDTHVYEGFLTNTHRYIGLVYTAADRSLQSKDYEIYKTLEDPKYEEFKITESEIKRNKEMEEGKVPAYLRVNFQIIIIPASVIQTIRMRGVNADCIGGLVCFEADILRVTLVKPRLQVAAYECQNCKQNTFMAIEGLHFMPLRDCPTCKINQNIANSLKFNPRRSKFTRYQEVRVQEPPSQVPEGDVPRSLNCVVLGESSEKPQPGMSLSICGTLLPFNKLAFAQHRSGLIAEKYFEVFHLESNKKHMDETDEDYEKIKETIQQLKEEDGLYEKLAFSLAPEVWGLEDVKKGLLLQLIGGCSKEKHDGGMIRGDIHVLLMGDPGVAKSQLLKKICAVAQRSVYTTGKGSSSVGLTAAVLKDPNTGETTLEGGALMDDFERSAIYEVMEQQSVSIAKAGHCSTLPARTAVLAAANPINGRYDPRRSVMANINLPAALLTRFDLQFLLLDTVDREKDIQLARHVLEIYSMSSSWANKSQEVVEKKVLRAFTSLAKKRYPKIASGLHSQIEEWYVSTRKMEYSQEIGDRSTYTTPRALLAILRLSQ